MLLPEAIVNDLKSARIVASPELRERVRAIAAAPPQPPAAPAFQLPRFPWRRIAFVGAPACLALVLASAVGIGLVRSSGEKTAVTPPPVALEDEKDGFSTGVPLTDPGRDALEQKAGTPANLPSSTNRVQLYTAELTLEVKDVSAASKRALRLTRNFKGYVRTLNVGSEGGTIVVRIPIGAVQAAIVQFSELGTIVGQEVRISDAQPQLDARFRKIQRLEKEIAKLQARLETPGLSADEREQIAGEIADYEAAVELLLRKQAALQRQTAYATVSLGLETPGDQAASAPGRFDRALDGAGGVLAREAEIALYVAIIGAPIALFAIGLLASARMRRRRADERLLAG